MKNYWLDRKKKKDDCGCSSKKSEYLRRRLERFRNFTRAMATGGSVEVNWEAIEKEEKEEKIKFDIPEIPPIIPMIDFPTEIKLDPPEINIPPLVFGTIDISAMNIPTEIKLVAPNPMPVINLILPTTIYCGTAGPVGPIPDAIAINWSDPVYIG